jgi:hypothetical protein
MALGMVLRSVVAAGLLALCALLMGGCEDTITEENFEAITVGMSLSEVESVLGAGTREDSGGYGSSSGGVITGGDSSGSSQQTYTWGETGRQIVVVFNNAKVQSKSKSGW